MNMLLVVLTSRTNMLTQTQAAGSLLSFLFTLTMLLLTVVFTDHYYLHLWFKLCSLQTMLYLWKFFHSFWTTDTLLYSTSRLSGTKGNYYARLFTYPLLFLLTLHWRSKIFSYKQHSCQSVLGWILWPSPYGKTINHSFNVLSPYLKDWHIILW